MDDGLLRTLVETQKAFQQSLVESQKSMQNKLPRSRKLSRKRSEPGTFIKCRERGWCSCERNCHYCRKPGHYRPECPDRLKAEAEREERGSSHHQDNLITGLVQQIQRRSCGMACQRVESTLGRVGKTVQDSKVRFPIRFQGTIQYDSKERFQYDSKERFQCDSKVRFPYDSKERFQYDSKERFQCDSKVRFPYDSKERFQCNSKVRFQCDTKVRFQCDSKERSSAIPRYDSSAIPKYDSSTIPRYDSGTSIRKQFQCSPRE